LVPRDAARIQQNQLLKKVFANTDDEWHSGLTGLPDPLLQRGLK
jgi:hypothetical protein